MIGVDPQERRRMIDDANFGNMIMAMIPTHHLRNPKRRGKSMYPAYQKEVHIYGVGGRKKVIIYMKRIDTTPSYDALEGLCCLKSSKHQHSPYTTENQIPLTIFFIINKR